MCSTRRRTLRLALPVALAALLLAPAPLKAQGQNKVVYDKFDWKIYSSTHFRIYHYGRGEAALQKVASMAESAYDDLSRRLNYQVPKPIPLLFYVSHAEFEQNNIILNFIPEGVGAFAEPARNRMVLPIDLPDEKLQNLISHELTHIFQYEILFGGRLSRAYTSNIPTWFMEGMASYFAKDEDEKDRMFIRDAVNSDQIPPITRVNINGYAAYRFGHAFFDFVEAEWGKDAVRELVFEFRSFLGKDIAASLKRAFEIEPDDFNMKFRRYLRRKYLPLLAVKGEASEYGERFRVGAWERPSYEVGAAPSPSGDFVATLTTYKEDIDIALLSTKSRKLWKNLSPGRTTKYEYISAQFLTQGPESGRDLSFAPDGDRIAVFARRERGRQLFIFSARGGGVIERIPVAPDMPLSPAFSPDGTSVVFSGISGTSRDIFLLDLASKAVRNLTSDEGYDTAPVFSPDGKYLYHTKVVAGLQKIVRFPLDDPSKIEQITWGEGNDDDAAFSPDGTRLYFASSRGGIFNIYGQDLGTGELFQYTDVIGAAIGPAAYVGPDGQEKVVFSGYQEGRFQLYVADAKKPFRRLEEKALAPAPIVRGAVPDFVPAIEVSIDPEKIEPSRFKLFVDDVGGYVGVNSDGTFLSSVRLGFSDYLGDKRVVFIWDTLAGYSNINAIYFNLKHRLQWGVQAYDNRTYFTGVNEYGQYVSVKRFSRETGASLLGVFPFSRYTRVEGVFGFLSRSIDEPYLITNDDGTQGQIYLPRKDNTLQVGAGYGYDGTRLKSFGPHGGQALSVNYRYLPDFQDGGTLSSDLSAEARVYVPISRRTNFAFRGFGAVSSGAVPTVYSFGGLDTLRGYDYRAIIGNRIFYLNTELRFPLIDVLITGIGLNFGGVRGRLFFDIGAAYLQNEDFTFAEGGRLVDGRAAYGAGFTAYFLGIPWNVDFARPTDMKSSLGGWQTTFYLGPATF
ncbi:MAG: PD40 domain-containing protein [Holophagales bacterium]|nr:PD40 domain-containing protein [Holophagales bacterium]